MNRERSVCDVLQRTPLSATSKPAHRADVAARLIPCLRAAAGNVRVADVRIGLGYTAVLLEDGNVGVAYTFRDQAQAGCSAFDGIRPLSTRPAADLLALLESEDVIKAAVGLACANALANRKDETSLDGDVLEHLDLRPEDHVGMVGNFGPLVCTIQKRVRSLSVFERIEQASGLLRPQKEALQVLPRCQVALITATAIINHSIDALIDAAAGSREVVLLGASTPLLTQVFGAQNVTMLSGVLVKNSEEVLRVVSEGGGMREFSPHVRKVTVRVGPSSKTRVRITK